MFNANYPTRNPGKPDSAPMIKAISAIRPALGLSTSPLIMPGTRAVFGNTGSWHFSMPNNSRYNPGINRPEDL